MSPADASPPSPRRQQILEALASELEKSPGQRITTARLAQAVGVSEAALYRHFPSKARMFEGLIGFAEEAVFGRVGLILAGSETALVRCEHILALLLGFAEINPGITRVLLGDALVGETPRLRERAEQFFRRLETQIKQVLIAGGCCQRSSAPLRAGRVRPSSNRRLGGDVGGAAARPGRRRYLSPLSTL